MVGAWVPHLPDVKASLGLMDRQLGFALLASGFGAVICMSFVGQLLHRFGSRNVTIWSCAAACLLVPFLVLQRSLPALIANQFAMGLCYGCLDVGMNAHSVAVQARHERPIMSAIHGCFSLGVFVGGFGAALAARLGAPPFVHMVLNSAVLLGVLAFCSFNLFPADMDKEAEGPKIVIPRGRLLTLGLLCLASFLAEGGVIDWGVTYLRNSLGATAELGAICTAMSAFFMAGGRFVGDGFVHQKGERWVLILSGFLLASGIWIAVNVPWPLASIAGFCLASLGIANTVPLFFNAGGNQPGISAGTGIAAITSCGYAGFLLGPPVIGFVADARSLGFSLGLVGIVGVVVVFSGPAAVARNTAPGVDLPQQ